MLGPWSPVHPPCVKCSMCTCVTLWSLEHAVCNYTLFDILTTDKYKYTLVISYITNHESWCVPSCVWDSRRNVWGYWLRPYTGQPYVHTCMDNVEDSPRDHPRVCGIQYDHAVASRATIAGKLWQTWNLQFYMMYSYSYRRKVENRLVHNTFSTPVQGSYDEKLNNNHLEHKMFLLNLLSTRTTDFFVPSPSGTNLDNTFRDG